MNVRHADKELERVEREAGYLGRWSDEIVKAYRKRMQFIRSAPDERDFYAMKSLHYEKLKGKRSHQRSMRLNKQFRLVLQLEADPFGNKRVVIVGIEDYH